MLSFLKKYMFVIPICVLSVLFLLYIFADFYSYSFSIETAEDIREEQNLSLLELYRENKNFSNDKTHKEFKNKMPLEAHAELIFFGVEKINFLLRLFAIPLLVIIIYLAVIANRLKSKL